LLVAAILCGCVVMPPGCGASGNPGGRPATGSPDLLPSAAADLPSLDYAGYQQLLAQLEGMPVIVNIWSSWCGPCRDEAPMLAHAAVAHQGVAHFLGIDILDDRGAATAFIERYRWTYPSVFDAPGAIRDELGFIGQPETLFYDARGDLASVWIGPLTSGALEDGLTEAGVMD
jgi:cytochrome c biogenesis protein CcmG/thiol:disulfide interchange protein DsbE